MIATPSALDPRPQAWGLLLSPMWVSTSGSGVMQDPAQSGSTGGPHTWTLSDLNTGETLEVAVSLGSQVPGDKVGVLTLSSGCGFKALRVNASCVSNPLLILHMYTLIQSSQLPSEVGGISSCIYR